MPEEKEYAREIYDYLGTLDKTYQKDVSFDSFKSSMSDKKYATDIHSWISSKDPSFTKDVPIDDFYSSINVKKKDQAMPTGSETSAPTAKIDFPISPLENSKATPPSDITRVTGNVDVKLMQNYEKIQQERKNYNKEKPLLYRPITRDLSYTHTKIEGNKIVTDDETKKLEQNADNSYKLAEPHIDELANRLVKSKKDEFFDAETKKPNLKRIAQFSENFAKSYGMPEDGYVYSALKTKIEAKVINQDIESSSEFRINFNNAYKKKTGKDFDFSGKKAESEVGQALIQKDLIAKDITNASTEKLNTYKKEVFIPKLKSIETNYKSAVEQLQAQAGQDPEAAAINEKFYADKTAEFTALVQQGQITPEMGNNMLRSEELKAQAGKTVNDFLNQKYKPAFDAAFKQYSFDRTSIINESLKVQNEVNANAKSRYQRQIGELKSELDNKLKGFKSNDAAIESSYKEAFDITIADRNMNALAAEKAINAKFGHIFNYGLATSTISSFARMMRTTAEALDLKDLALQSEIFEKEYAGADDPTTQFKDLLNWSKLSKSTGNMIGSMLPSIAVGAAVAWGTGGSSLPLAGRIAMTGMSGFLTETPSIMGDAYSSTLAKTGSEDKARKASNTAFQSQVIGLPLYMMDGIKFFPSVLKKFPVLGQTLAGRAVVGAVGEYTGEFMQEGWQGLSERAYMDNKDLSHMFDEGWLNNLKVTGLNIAPTIVLGGGSPIAQAGIYNIKGKLDTRRGKAFAASQNLAELIPEQKSQFFAKLALEKSASYANAVLSTMLTSGSITQEEFDNIAPFVVNIETNRQIVIEAKNNGANGSNQFFLSSLLAQQNILQNQVKTDPSLQTQLDEINSRIANISSGKNENLYGIIYPDNSSFSFDEKTYKSLMADEEFRNKLKDKSIKLVFAFDEKNKRDSAIKAHLDDLYGFSISPEVETIPKVTAPVDSEKRAEEQRQLDEKITAFQERTGYKPDDLSVDLNTGITLDRLDNGIPVDPIAVEEASNALYAKYKQYENMLDATSRYMTTDQIKGLMSELEGYITKLENVKNGKDFNSEVATGTAPLESTADTRVDTVVEAPKPYQESVSSRDVEQGFAEDTVEGFLGSQYYADIIASAKAEGLTAAQVIKDLYKNNAFDNLETREDIDAIEVQLKRELAGKAAPEVSREVAEPIDEFIEANYTQIVADLKLNNKIKTEGCAY